MTIKSIGVGKVVAVFLALSMAACTTVQTRNSGTATLSEVPADRAYQIVTQAAMNAGFTIESSDSVSRMIIATRGANALLTYENPKINISVVQFDSNSRINISSTVGGQIADYGTTGKTIEDFCVELVSLYPSAVCNRN